jgi:hypothetical protein
MHLALLISGNPVDYGTCRGIICKRGRYSTAWQYTRERVDMSVSTVSLDINAYFKLYHFVPSQRLRLLNGPSKGEGGRYRTQIHCPCNGGWP